MPYYCDFAPGHPWHGPYHDNEYGFPVRDDSVLFERLVLEINQAGLSWLTILKKREQFHIAYDKFDIDRVAAYGDREKGTSLSHKQHFARSRSAAIGGAFGRHFHGEE